MKLLLGVVLAILIIIQGADSIYGGKTIKIEQFPYAVTIWNMRTVPDGIFYNGVIITPRFILTSGPTLLTPRFAPSTYRVQAGVATRKPEENSTNVQTRTVSSILRHPQYSTHFENNQPVWYENDIALLELSQPFEITAAVQPIKKTGHGVPEFCSICHVSGWGSEHLKLVRVIIAVQSMCEEIGPRLLADQLCGATLHSEDLLNLLDQGNPVVCDGELVGIVDTLGFEPEALWTLRSIIPHVDFLWNALDGTN